MSLCSVIPRPKLPTPARWRLLADHEVEAEVLGAGAAVALGHGHAEEAAAAGVREHLARDDPVALPLAVAALVADHLALEERAKARAEVFVDVLEQAAPHRRGGHYLRRPAAVAGLGQQQLHVLDAPLAKAALAVAQVQLPQAAEALVVAELGQALGGRQEALAPVAQRRARSAR